MEQRKPKRGDKVGEYVLEEKLGGGGFGEVWKASHPLLQDEIVAVKIPTDPAFIENLKREGVMQADLRNEHIVEVRGLDPNADPPYLTMEYVAGKSLRQLLEERRRLPLRDAVDIVLQALAGLEAAHQRGVIHHDIKPENILLTEEGVVKLADFGLGRALETTASMILQSGSLVTGAGSPVTGTLRYMAPEQREGQRGDRRSDLYALGVVFFEILTGEFPQGAEVPSEVHPDLPTWVDRVFQRCYTRLERRYNSAGEMAGEIRSHNRSGIVFLGKVTVRPGDGASESGETPSPPGAAAQIRPPRSLLLWPIYLLFLLFHTLARGTQEVIRFLSGDHPQRSALAPYFVLFLGIFGISLLISVMWRNRWFETRDAARTITHVRPSGENYRKIDTRTLVVLLKDANWRERIRRELLRRGEAAFTEVQEIYQDIRSRDPELRSELDTLIREFQRHLHTGDPPKKGEGF
jgi:serine/threonine protein kinase